MSKKIYVVFFLIFSSCYIINTNKILSNKNTGNFIIHAQIIADSKSFTNSKLKTKITISTDTIIAVIYPILGLELAQIEIADNYLFIENRYKKTNKLIKLSEIDPKLDLKKIQNSIIQLTHKKDTIKYNNSSFGWTLTDYKPVDVKLSKKIFFLPETIILHTQEADKSSFKKDKITIKYKSIKFQSIVK